MTRFRSPQLIDQYQLVPAGDTIFQTGDPGDAMYILLEGVVYITLDDHVLDKLTAETVFGEMALVDSQPRSASAVAHSDCKLIKIDEARFVELTAADPAFALGVMNIMSIRTRRLIQEEIARYQLEKELAIGKQIQRGLLPNGVPVVDGWEFAAYYQAAKQVGGDLYDFILHPDDKNILQLLVADVTGKGVPAALFMASMRSMLRTLGHQNLGPADILMRSNRAIIEDMRTPLFLSCLFARLDLVTGELRLASAGHDWPIWVRQGRPKPEMVPLSGTILGILGDLKVEERTIALQPGDSFILYTDGVTEARNRDGKFLDDDRLLEIIDSYRGYSATDLVAAIVDQVDLFVAGHPPSDDITLVVIKRSGAETT